MQTRTYTVTNNGEGSICVTGRTRIDIPGKCRDLKLVLPENSARQTVARLKQRYPLLRITEVRASDSSLQNVEKSQDNSVIDANGKKEAEKDISVSDVSAAGKNGKDQHPAASSGKSQDNSANKQNK